MSKSQLVSLTQDPESAVTAGVPARLEERMNECAVTMRGLEVSDAHRLKLNPAFSLVSPSKETGETGRDVYWTLISRNDH